MKTSAVLRGAGDVLRERGWVQNSLETSAGFCAIGAIAIANANSFAGDHAQSLRDIVCGGAPCVDVWNDSYGRTKDEVLIALDAAYVLALQEEGVEPWEVL